MTLEFSSRGDRVPAHVVLPDTAGPHPVVILEHGLGGSRHSDYLQVGARWVREGAAVATLDLPLHGERASAKMSARLLSSVDRSLADPTAQLDSVENMLWTEFARQAVHDLSRLVDALGSVDAIDVRRLAFAGFSLGGIVGAVFCALDPRPLAAALTVAGGGFGPPEVDPVAHISAISPRPVLMVNALGDERIARAASEALFEAASEPKQIVWFEGTHRSLPGAAMKEMWGFLRGHLGLGLGLGLD